MQPLQWRKHFGLPSMHKAEATPWRAWINAACALGVAPGAFWRLSLSEWRALIVAAPTQTLARADLDALVHAFPDKT
jgi:uncharacterized phage protein (TIGR02216 family)